MITLSISASLAIIFAAAVIGAIPPLLGKWNNRQLHLFIAFGAGVFIGAVFFHLIPEAMTGSPDILTNFMVLTGFMIVLIVDRLIVPRLSAASADEGVNRHLAVSLSAFAGLSIHSLVAGFSLGAGLVSPQVAFVIVLAIISHKTIAAFSLATMLRLSNIPLKRSILLLAVFSSLTPIGALVSYFMFTTFNEAHYAIPTALAAGSFLYVASMNMLPEAFHYSESRLGPLLALSAGIAVMIAITGL